ncbi:hypothetical protein DRA43_09875, partial [Micromonospora provocatoris]
MPLPHPARVRRHHRSADRTGRLRSVRVQLLAPILVATAGLVVLGAAQTGAALAYAGITAPRTAPDASARSASNCWRRSWWPPPG